MFANILGLGMENCRILGQFMHSDIGKKNSLNYSLFRIRDNILINLGHLDMFLDSDI